MYFQGNFNAQFPQSIFFFLCSTHSKEILKRGCLLNLGNCKPQRFHLPRNSKEWFTFWWWKEEHASVFRYKCVSQKKEQVPWDIGRGWSETGGNLRNRTRPRRGFTLQHGCRPPIRMLSPWPEGARRVVSVPRNYSAMRPPHTREAESPLPGCPALSRATPWETDSTASPGVGSSLSPTASSVAPFGTEHLDQRRGEPCSLPSPPQIFLCWQREKRENTWTPQKRKMMF